MARSLKGGGHFGFVMRGQDQTARLERLGDFGLMVIIMFAAGKFAWHGDDIAPRP